MASSSQNESRLVSQDSDDRSVGENTTSNDRDPTNEHNDWDKQNILSFDGGGIRGYYSLLHLQYLMKRIEYEEEKQQRHSQQQDTHNGRLSSFSPCVEPLDVSHYAPGAAPFLPCHYFDYISGTSTGALITIMLTTLRMSVDDCLKEYENLAGPVFGHSRFLHHAGNPVGFVFKKDKYSSTNLENAIKDVMRRRGEESNDHDDAMQFTTPKGLCRAIVLATRNVLGGVNKGIVDQPWIFRSYDNFDTRRTGAPNTEPLNPGRGTKFAAWKVARAATAAPLFFKPLKIALDDGEVNPNRRRTTRRSSHQWLDEARRRRPKVTPQKRETALFTDAGFSRVNNPSKAVLEELRTIFRNRPNKKVANWISIGTARKPPPRDTSSLPAVLRKAVSQLGDPEVVHHEMEREQFKYYRFNEENSLLDIDMDEWKPRSGPKQGSQTIEAIESAFNKWSNVVANQEMVKSAARRLVNIRRARVGDFSKWERFALGRFFICCEDNCIYDTDQTWNYRDEFKQHLKAVHDYSDTDVEREIDRCIREWNYKAPGLYG